jgi:hypothetical protein
MHASFNLFFMNLLFTLLQLSLLRKQFLFSFVTCSFKGIDSFRRKPTSHTALDVQRSLLSFLGPHSAAEIPLRVNNFVVSAIDVQARLLHLTALFAHHMRRFRFVLVSLDKTFVSVRVVVSDLICLGEGMVIGDTGAIVSEATEVRLWPLLFFNVDSHNLNLVV